VPVSKSKRSRYTPPPPKNEPHSPLWVPALMFALLGCGLLVIVFNYLDLLPGGIDNRNLLFGLVEMTAGFIVATIYR
jgi:hypothetical protein